MWYNARFVRFWMRLLGVDMGSISYWPFTWGPGNPTMGEAEEHFHTKRVLYSTFDE